MLKRSRVHLRRVRRDAGIRRTSKTPSTLISRRYAAAVSDPQRDGSKTACRWGVELARILRGRPAWLIRPRSTSLLGGCVAALDGAAWLRRPPHTFKKTSKPALVASASSGRVVLIVPSVRPLRRNPAVVFRTSALTLVGLNKSTGHEGNVKVNVNCASGPASKSTFLTDRPQLVRAEVSPGGLVPVGCFPPGTGGNHPPQGTCRGGASGGSSRAAKFPLAACTPTQNHGRGYACQAREKPNLIEETLRLRSTTAPAVRLLDVKFHREP